MFRVISLLLLQVSGIGLTSGLVFGNDVWSALPRLVNDDFGEPGSLQNYDTKQCSVIDGCIRLGDNGALIRQLDMRISPSSSGK